MQFHLTEWTIKADDIPLLDNVGEKIELVPDETGSGVFLRAGGRSECHIWSVALGTLAGLDRFTACYRGESPFWMEPRAGTTVAEVPGDTQWLLARRTDGRFVLLVPLFDDPLRFCLDGRDGVLRLWADSGDPWTVCHEGIGAFLAVGDDPYALQQQGAIAVQRRLATCLRRSEKPLPDFADLFGWCTWDAFYRDVSADRVRQGLDSFREGGVSPKFLILDDGWLSVREMPLGGSRLAGFQANDKFPGGLAPLIAAARQEYGVERCLVWHTVVGYWAGVDSQSLPGYDVREVPRADLPAFGRDPAPMLGWMGALCGMVPPDRIAALYDEFHQALAAQGVDGVKVDNQSSLELSSACLGGRVRVSLAYRRALEQSCRRHFGGRLINCMSCSNEMFLMAADSTLMRTSTDFWPARPETHGAHLYTNAQVGMWFGQFVHPDWDMFQSGHAMGAYHAAARAISGSPVYVSDTPDGHDFAVLRKIVCADGSVLRCTDIGRPTPDCLFHDPTREDRLLKIFNFNQHGAVLGIFHARYDGGSAPAISGAISPDDIPGLPRGRCAVLAHRSGELRLMGPGDAWSLCLDPGQWEIFTFAPLHGETAVLGLADKYNTGGAVRNLRHQGRTTRCRVRDGGLLICYAARAPAKATLDSRPIVIKYDAGTGIAQLPIAEAGEVTLEWDEKSTDSV
jgi:raffinose synthase